MYLLGNPADGQGGIGAVKVTWPQVEPQIYGQRTGVFGQEDSLPADLWTQILHIQLAAVAQVERLQGVRVLERLALYLQTQRLSVNVDCKLIGNLLFHLQNSRLFLQRALAHRLAVGRTQYLNLWGRDGVIGKGSLVGIYK